MANSCYQNNYIIIFGDYRC